MVIFLIRLVDALATILVFAIIAQTLLSYFMAPYHPVRQTLDRIIGPMLNPIRRVLPTLGGLDFSPLVLVILIQIVESLLTRILRNFV
ncbi:MAG TPA: YggT family protein [Anaerolineales bacterium]|nr:YggT family protein [Anaerolineales bacterium]